MQLWRFWIRISIRFFIVLFFCFAAAGFGVLVVSWILDFPFLLLNSIEPYRTVQQTTSTCHLDGIFTRRTGDSYGNYIRHCRNRCQLLAIKGKLNSPIAQMGLSFLALLGTSYSLCLLTGAFAQYGTVREKKRKQKQKTEKNKKKERKQKQRKKRCGKGRAEPNAR